MKEKLLNQDTYNYAKQEAALHEMVSNHNNVVRLYDQKEDDKQFQMIMEYADKGDYFADKINEVSLIFSYQYFQSLLNRLIWSCIEHFQLQTLIFHPLNLISNHLLAWLDKIKRLMDYSAASVQKTYLEHLKSLKLLGF